MDHDYKITGNNLAKTRESESKKKTNENSDQKQRKTGAVAKHLY